MWPHAQTGYPGPTTVYYWDMILGDGQTILSTDIDAMWTALILHNDTLHVFTPYT